MARTVISGNVIASQSNRVGRKGQNVRKAVYIRVSRSEYPCHQWFRHL